MGYTHYHRQKGDCPPAVWQAICHDVKKLMAANDVPIEGWEDDPIITADAIIFNGVGDDAHETFDLNRCQRPPYAFEEHDDEYARKGAFECCKTAYKPYDLLVCQILLVADRRAPDTYQVSSDGDLEDWLPAIKSVATLLGQPLYIPRFLREDLLQASLGADFTETERQLLTQLTQV